MNKVSKYFFESWILDTGVGWTKNQVFVSYLFSVFFTGAVLAYSCISGLKWSGIQMFAVAWGLSGGGIEYSHKSIKLNPNYCFQRTPPIPPDPEASGGIGSYKT